MRPEVKDVQPLAAAFVAERAEAVFIVGEDLEDGASAQPVVAAANSCASPSDQQLLRLPAADPLEHDVGQHSGPVPKQPYGITQTVLPSRGDARGDGGS